MFRCGAAPGSFAEVAAVEVFCFPLAFNFLVSDCPRLTAHRGRTNRGKTLQIFQSRSRRSLEWLGLAPAHTPSPEPLHPEPCVAAVTFAAAFSGLGSFPCLIHLLHRSQSCQGSSKWNFVLLQINPCRWSFDFPFVPSPHTKTRCMKYFCKYFLPRNRGFSCFPTEYSGRVFYLMFKNCFRDSPVKT